MERLQNRVQTVAIVEKYLSSIAPTISIYGQSPKTNVRTNPLNGQSPKSVV